MTELEYHIVFPKVDAYFIENTLSFSIENMKSRLASAVYFIFYAYDRNGDKIYEYKSDRWVVDETYSRYTKTFTIDENITHTSCTYQVELVAINITSENPLYFNKVMLQEGEYDGYHIPHEIIKEKRIGFKKASYTNLYLKDGNYLQVIRPIRDDISTTKLNASKVTVLAPHFEDEEDVDSPVSVFYEYINQTEQRIDILR